MTISYGELSPEQQQWAREEWCRWEGAPDLEDHYVESRIEAFDYQFDVRNGIRMFKNYCNTDNPISSFPAPVHGPYDTLDKAVTYARKHLESFMSGYDVVVKIEGALYFMSNLAHTNYKGPQFERVAIVFKNGRVDVE